MQKTEGGDWLIPEDERPEYRKAAEFLREQMDIVVDLNQPMPVETALYLKWCQLCVQKDFETIGLVLAEFDRMIAARRRH